MLLCIILLGSLSLLGLAASFEQQLQVRIMGNIEQAATAERAAGWALAWAEDWLFSIDGGERPKPCQANCAPAEIIRDESTFPAAPEHADLQWWLAHGFAAGTEPGSGEVLDPFLDQLAALAVIGEIPVSAEHTDELPGRPRYYRVLARAEASRGRQVVVLESIVARPWGQAAWTDPLPASPVQPRLCARQDLEPCGRLAWRRLR